MDWQLIAAVGASAVSAITIWERLTRRIAKYVIGITKPHLEQIKEEIGEQIRAELNGTLLRKEDLRAVSDQITRFDMRLESSNKDFSRMQQDIKRMSAELRRQEDRCFRRIEGCEPPEKTWGAGD